MVLSVLHIHAAYCGAAGRHPGRGCHGAVLLAGVPDLRTGQPAAGTVPYLICKKDTGVSLYFAPYRRVLPENHPPGGPKSGRDRSLRKMGAVPLCSHSAAGHRRLDRFTGGGGAADAYLAGVPGHHGRGTGQRIHHRRDRLRAVHRAGIIQ